MTRLPRPFAFTTTALILAAGAAPAIAGTPLSTSGGFQPPAVDALTCGDGAESTCARGAVLRISGTGLAQTKRVVFLGGRGKRDDRSARPQERRSNSVVVTVPPRARSGRIQAVVEGERLRGPKLTVTEPQQPPARAAVPVSATGGGTFPVRGDHDYGTGTNTFGGGRNHGGQDVLAKCDTPLVAARAGTVHKSDFEGAAGNYLVINLPDGSSDTYMHMRDPSSLKTGDSVAAGAPIGVVGQTGRASTCHLHFEHWTAPGWYQGGKAVDPLPILRELEKSTAAEPAATAASVHSSSWRP